MSRPPAVGQLDLQGERARRPGLPVAVVVLAPGGDHGDPATDDHQADQTGERLAQPAPEAAAVRQPQHGVGRSALGGRHVRDSALQQLGDVHQASPPTTSASSPLLRRWASALLARLFTVPAEMPSCPAISASLRWSQ